MLLVNSVDKLTFSRFQMGTSLPQVVNDASKTILGTRVALTNGPQTCFQTTMVRDLVWTILTESRLLVYKNHN